ncbi:MAG: phosphoribosylformylglycinamidine synthase subunit PurQ, partial [Candidatus Dormibacteraeota bacterium]|nr:phosphoribosylformylglycinamidine synthase subunit PurQ [Candidatus Dormibacteraeota bacterium]
MRFGVVVFPGTWSDRDMRLALSGVEGAEAIPLWHKERDLQGADCVILPGGFSYGDYLRTGAIARFSPVLESVVEFAAQGGLVLGSCNGFQVLCEAGLLAGALVRNANLEFRCQWQHMVCERGDTPFTQGIHTGQVLRMPISHGEGNYVADPATLSRLEQNRQVVFRYCDSGGLVDAEANPNGSQHNIAGIVNERGNVLGMMPHPERCADADLGGLDGLRLFEAILRTPAGVRGAAGSSAAP